MKGWHLLIWISLILAALASGAAIYFKVGIINVGL